MRAIFFLTVSESRCNDPNWWWIRSGSGRHFSLLSVFSCQGESDESEEDESTTEEQRKARQYRKRKAAPGWSKENTQKVPVPTSCLAYHVFFLFDFGFCCGTGIIPYRSSWNRFSLDALNQCSEFSLFWFKESFSIIFFHIEHALDPSLSIITVK